MIYTLYKITVENFFVPGVFRFDVVKLFKEDKYAFMGYKNRRN